MLKKIIIGATAVFALAFAYWTISPFFINKVVQEDLPASSVGYNSDLAPATQNIGPDNADQAALPPKKVASGSFEGFDKIHDGEGEVVIYEIDGKRILRFEEGFRVSNGPDLYVGFGSNGKYVKGSEIARLKGNVGSQNYEIPADVPLEQYDSVYVWCRAFSVPFVKADLVRLEQDLADRSISRQ